MSFEIVLTIVRWGGGIALAVVLVTVFYGIARGLKQSFGNASGKPSSQLQNPIFYLVSGSLFFGLCWILWKPIPFHPAHAVRVTALIGGAILYFTGVGLILWGRITLGKFYFVSSSSNAGLFAGHRLIKEGPFAIVRHPMYLGILLAGLGGILLYQTWTWVLVAAMFIGLIRRARVEEQALKDEFGDSWGRYSRRVPMFIPRLRRPKFAGSPATHPPDDDSHTVTVRTIVVLTAAMVIFVCLIGGLGTLFGYRNYQSAVQTQTAAPAPTQTVFPPND